MFSMYTQYLPMGYLYGSRYVYSKVDSDPLIAELRTEVSVNFLLYQFFDVCAP